MQSGSLGRPCKDVSADLKTLEDLIAKDCRDGKDSLEFILGKEKPMREGRENQSKLQSVTAAGEVILVPTQGWLGTFCGAPLCFATLAYLNQVDEREKFILAVRSSQRKGLMKPQGIRLPDTLRAAFPKMRERKAQGAWNMGRKRIHHRVTMGSLGWAVFAGDGVCYLYSEPTADGKIGLELHGVGSLTKGVRELAKTETGRGRSLR